MNKCMTCQYSKSFLDPFVNRIRYKCGINQMEYDYYGDGYLIIDGECDKYEQTNKILQQPTGEKSSKGTGRKTSCQ